MCASLATIASDFISLLVLRLNGDDFALLMASGNRLLRHKLRLCCEALLFKKTAFATKFPFAALDLPKLRSLTVHCIAKIPTHLDFRHGGALALTRGSKTLEEINFRFENSHALFMSYNSSIRRLTVRERFPALTTLILQKNRIDTSHRGAVWRISGKFNKTRAQVERALLRASISPFQNIKAP